MDVVFERAPYNLVPKCPHCGNRLNRVWVVPQGLGFFQRRQLIVCPKCEAILGYGSVRFFG